MAIGRRIVGFDEEFMAFLLKYQVIGLAVAVVIGTAATKLVNSTVDDLIMPWWQCSRLPAAGRPRYCRLGP